MIGRRVLCRLDHLFRAAIVGMLCFTAWGMVHAQSTHYVYDANGRVVAVTANNGASVQYGYNKLGQASQVGAPLSSGQLTIFAFMPTHGEAGAQVTLQGQGFDSNAANDTVSFNGVPATVISASSTQLVTTVPNGVTTGPISVTVGTQTATSATPFTVDDTGVPPTITQITPLAVSSGSVVTVAGAHLNPVAGATVVQVGDLDQSPSSLSDSQVQFAMTAAESGTVSVSTPYGVALSQTPLFVLASGLNPANFVSGTAATVNGASVSLTIGAGGQMGGALFQGTAGSWLSLQLNTITTSANNLTYQIYGPGNVLVQSGSVSTTSPSIHLPQLTATGNYVAIFQPDTAGAQLSMTVQTDLALVKTTPYAIVTSQAWRSEGMVFTADSGANMELELTGLNVTGGSQNQVAVQVSNAAGSIIASFNCTGSATTTTYCHQPLWNMAAGMYRVTVIPSSGGTMAFNAILQPDVIGPALTPNAPLVINMSAGQMERVTFNATEGQSVALSLSNIATPAGQFLAVFVYTPNTTVPTFSNYYALRLSSDSNILNLPNLPTTGTYTVVIGSADSVPVTGQLTLLSNVGGPLSVDGSNHSYVTSASGQNVYLSFSANDGDDLDLELTNLTIFGGGQNIAGVQVTNASGTVIASISCAGSANTATYCHLPLWNMTTGTYTVTVYPLSGGTMKFSATLQPNIIGPALTSNTPLAFDLSAGQMERVTFNGTAGQALALSLSNASTVDGRFLAVIVYAPGGAITQTNYYGYLNSNNSTLLNLGNLPVSGTYTVVIGSEDSAPTTGQLTLIPGQEGTVPTDGTSQTYSTNVFNQDVGLSFTANTGDNLELELTNVNVNGGNPNQVTVQVSDAAGNVIGTVNCPGSTTAATYCHQPLWNLTAGTYSALVYPSGGGTPNGGGTMAFNALVAPDVIGPALTSNTPLDINLSAGPMERVTFNATAGQTATLSLSNVNAAGGRFMAVFVYTPNTSSPTMSNYYGLLNSSTSPTLTLPNLPATGTYTMVIGVADSAPASARLTLTLQ
jgi:YD repeat-containing protein